MQNEVLAYLKKHKRWFSSIELMQVFGTTRPTINVNLQKLERFGFIERKKSRTLNNSIEYLARIKNLGVKQ